MLSEFITPLVRYFLELVLSCFYSGYAYHILLIPLADPFCRVRLLEESHPLDPRRTAAAIVFFPDHRTLGGGEDDPTAVVASGAGAGAAGFASAAGPSAAGGGWHCAAAYDPAFLLPFCVHGLRSRAISARSFTQWGLLGLCLRSLASPDAALRSDMQH